jgi:hypothetical protein
MRAGKLYHQSVEDLRQSGKRSQADRQNLRYPPPHSHKRSIEGGLNLQKPTSHHQELILRRSHKSDEALDTVQKKPFMKFGENFPKFF